MSVEQEVANLTAAINTLTDTVNVRKAVLDQAVDDAETLASQADGSRQAAETAATGAAASKSGADATKALMDTALAAVTDYSNTLGLLSPAAKEIVAAADVVAVFIYDTTKDSDGGKWRKRCRHTSWYNETLGTATRGSRRGFPQKALIVARATSLTLYDLDTANCPMWGVAPSTVITSLTSVVASNGKLIVGAGSSKYVAIFDFIDPCWRVHNFSASGLTIYSGTTLSTLGSVVVTLASGAIVNSSVNAVAATILPGTPIDPVRGLPNPTVAVATAGGVSVIHWDGRVCNSTSTLSFSTVIFDHLSALWFTRSGYVMNVFRADPASYAASGFGVDVKSSVRFPALQTTGPGRFISAERAIASAGSLFEGAAANGLGISYVEPAKLAASMSALLTNTFNTGYQVGDIKAALAESTADLTSLTASVDAITNVTTSLGVIGGLRGVVSQSTDQASSGTKSAKYLCNEATNAAHYMTLGSVPAGTAVTISGKIFLPTGSLDCVALVDTSDGSINTTIVSSFVGTKNTWVPFTIYRPAKASNWPMALGNTALESIDGQAFYVDDLSIILHTVKDRSVAGNNPRTYGTITRTAVATGAELAAYGGFSASNYLQIPYSSAFDFGTGDFCFGPVLFKVAANSSTERILELSDYSGSYSGAYVSLTQTVSGYVDFTVSDDGGATSDRVTVSVDYSDDRWHWAAGVRRGSVIEVWIDGELKGTANVVNAAASLSNSNAVLGIGQIGKGALDRKYSGLIALPRVSRTAPTPAQIRQLARDELVLCQPNAKCLLPGANVSALAYDDSTELLHVATTAGSARLRGLLVVDKDATVYTGIDARDGIVATRDSGSADIVLPSIPLREAAAAGIGHNGGPPLYDRRTARASAVTTNATPTVIARFPMDRGEFGEWVIRTVAKEYDAGTELAAYEDVLLARRPGEGNVAISGSVTQRVIQEVTSSMAVTIAANTTTQCIEVTATGVASKNIEWTVEGRLA